MANDTMTLLPAGAVSTSRMRIVKGIFQQDWLAHGNFFLWILAIWLIGQWVLMVFANLAWVTVFGMVLAKFMGAALGGKEAREGSEEFTFALPPTRGQRYLVRMIVGLTCVLFFCGMSVLAVNFNLPQKFWGLFVDSGLTQPFPANSVSPALAWYWAIFLPLTIFCDFFVAGACRRALVWILVVFAGLILAAVGIMQLCKIFSVSCPPEVIIAALLLITGPTILLVGFFLYTRKEGIVPAGFVPPVRRPGRGVWIIVLILVILMIFILPIVMSYRAFSTSDSATISTKPSIKIER
jgi:hypothetical protein